MILPIANQSRLRSCFYISQSFRHQLPLVCGCSLQRRYIYNSPKHNLRHLSTRELKAHSLYNNIHQRRLSLTALKKKSVSFNLSDIGEGIREVVVKEWYVSVGDNIHQFDSICEVQSDKASVTITSRYDGVIAKLYHEVEDIALVGQPLVDIETEDGDDTQVEVEEPVVLDSGDGHVSSDSSDSDSDDEDSVKKLATPAVRRLASEHKLDISKVKGTGKDGRVLKDDVLLYLAGSTGSSAPPASPVARPAPAPATAAAVPAAPAVKEFVKRLPPAEKDYSEPIKGIRKVMTRVMSDSLRIPHFGYKDEIDMTHLHQLRGSFKHLAAQRGVKFSYMPLFIKAASLALSQYPAINSSVDAEIKNLTYHSNHNFGIAMDTPDGLLVPVVKGVQVLSVFEIAEDLNRLAALGSEGKLAPSDLTGATFSLSNIGSIGGTYATPVIFAPTVCIGAIGRVQRVPRFDEKDNVVAAHICNISWSADHRILDGATVARFSNLFKNYLENPATMLLDLK